MTTNVLIPCTHISAYSAGSSPSGRPIPMALASPDDGVLRSDVLRIARSWESSDEHRRQQALVP
jgi:hypothetical protein